MFCFSSDVQTISIDIGAPIELSQRGVTGHFSRVVLPGTCLDDSATMPAAPSSRRPKAPQP